MDEEAVGRVTAAVQETGAMTFFARRLFNKLAIAVLVELTENELAPGQIRAATLTLGGIEYLFTRNLKFTCHGS